MIHVNQLKGWVGPNPDRTQVLAELCMDPDEDERHWETEGGKPARPPPLGDSLSPTQVRQLRELLEEFPLSFSSKPGITTAVVVAWQHHPGVVVRVPWRPLPHKRWEAVEKKVADCHGKHP